MSSIIANISGRQLRLPLLPVLVGVYATLAACLAPHTYTAQLRSYLSEAIVAAPVLMLVLLPAGIMMSPRAPLTFIVQIIIRNGPRSILVLTGFCAGLAGFTTFKLAIPTVVPFYADPFLADVDNFLHFGNPGEFVHAIVPQWAAYLLGFLYGPVWFALWFGLSAFVALHDSKQLRDRYFWAMGLTFAVLGTGVAMILSSVGPVFYEAVYGGHRFTTLMTLVDASTVGDYMRETSGYLYENYMAGGDAVGTGISAMPSVHLAVVTLNALMLGSLNRYIGAIAWFYATLILIGSVFLGWHYAIDGYVSIGVVVLIWWGTGRLLDRRIVVPVSYRLGSPTRGSVSNLD